MMACSVAVQDLLSLKITLFLELLLVRWLACSCEVRQLQNGMDGT